MSQIAALKFIEDLVVNPRHRIRVYADPNTGKRFIAKVLKQSAADEETRAVMKHEYEIGSSLEGESHIKPLALEELDSTPVILYEDFGGISLAEVLHQGSLDLEAFFQTAISLVEGLEQIHFQSVAHQDIKPSNLIVNLRKGECRYNDFTLAKKWTRLEEKWVAGGRGSVDYMSPEQTGRIDVYIDYRTDFYSLGATFYEMICGRLPFVTTNLGEIVHAHIARLPDAPHTVKSHIPEQLSFIILKMMAKRPKDRYKSALGLKNDLIRCFTLWKENKADISFPLGEKDKGGIFEISPGFYGREHEFEAIKQITQKRGRKFPLLVLVSGPPGSGKTSFVSELTRKVELNEGYFIRGKFDQYQRHRPLSAMVSAFALLFEKIHAKKGEDVKAWFKEVLGDNLPAITQLVPSLELLLGKQGKAVEVSPSDAQNRFAYNVSKIIELTSSEENPTIMFLDDLQWADAASLHLFYSLLTNKKNPGLIIVGAYRDTEVDQAHPLMLTLQKLEKEVGTFNEIAMGPLEPEAANQLIADSLEREDEAVKSLSYKLYSKSAGNPLLTQQLLITLYEKKLINFEPQKLLWDWKEDEIARVQIDEHIVDLIVSKIHTLSDATKKMLFLAASFGDEMVLGVLSKVIGIEEVEAVAHAEKALGLGLIDLTRMKEDYRLVFCHDRFREACNQIIPKEKAIEEHKKLGVALIDLWDEEDRDKHIFQITNLLNQATSILDEQEKRSLANYNLIASQKAIDSFAFKQGLQFVETGVSLLPDDAWSTEYALMFKLHENGIVASGELKDDKKIRYLFNNLVNNSKSVLETTQSYVRLMHYFYYLGQIEESIQVGVDFLKELNFYFPTKGNKLLVIKEYLVTRILYWWKIERKQERSELTDSRMRAIIDIQDALNPPIFFRDMPLLAYNIFQLYHHVLSYGKHEKEICYRIPFFYVGRALFRDLTLSRTLIDEVNLDNYKSCPFFPQLAMIYCMGLRNYVPLRQVILETEEQFLYCISMGNVTYSTTLFSVLCVSQLSAGFPLYKYKQLIQEYEELNKKLGVLGAQWISVSIDGICDALLNGEEYSVFIEGERRETDACFSWLENKGMKAQCFNLSCLITLLHLVVSRDDTAWSYSKKGAPLRKDALAIPFKEHFILYEVLAAGFCYEQKSKQEQKEIRKISKSNIKELKSLMRQQKENFEYKYWMACAEYALMKGDDATAHNNYRKGIMLAKENGFLQDTAIAFERCSRIMLSQNDDLLAKTYMMQAIEFYDRWGAKAKVTVLEQEYEQLFPTKKEEKQQKKGKETTTLTKTVQIGDRVDTQSYIDAAEAISEQIELESVMKILVDVVFRNAGAEYVVLLTAKENEWFVTAEKAGRDKEVRYLSIPLKEASSKVPLTIIGELLQSQKELVIRDAITDTECSQDPYVVDTKCRSILCLPLIYQNKMLAALYLENSLMEGAFTEERVQNILLLSTHIANALENAFLYKELKEYSEDLDIKVKERTKEIAEKNIALVESNDALNVTLDELKKTQKQLIASEKLASLGELTAGIAHEIRNPLNFINNFSTINIGLAEENRELYGQIDTTKIEEETSEQLQDNLVTLEDNQKRILSYGQRLAQIVDLMERHAKVGKGGMQSTPISGLIDRSLAAAKMDFSARYPDFSLSIDKYYDESVDQVSLVPDEMDFVLSNVIKNALEAMVEKGEEDKEYEPHLNIQTERVADMVGITIKDNGMGIEEKNLDDVFNPFFTTKPTGQAIGLALSISHMIVTSIHHGYMTISSQPGLFTEVTITLPIE